MTGNVTKGIYVNDRTGLERNNYRGPICKQYDSTKVAEREAWKQIKQQQLFSRSEPFARNNRITSGLWNTTYVVYTLLALSKRNIIKHAYIRSVSYTMLSMSR